MDEAKILDFAKKEGYDHIRYIGKWRGYDSYEPLVKGASKENPAIIGLPFTILVKGDMIRMSTAEEAMEQIAEEE